MDAASSNPRCRFDVVWRAYGRCGAAAVGWALGKLLTFVFAVVPEITGTKSLQVLWGSWSIIVLCFLFSIWALLASFNSMVGSLVGIVIGACMGMSAESGMLRGAGVGAISCAVFSIDAVESCIEIWRSSESAKYSILFVLDIISSLFSGRIVWEKVSPALQRAVQSQMSLPSTPFIDNNDLFETGGTGGMSRDLINKIPAIRFSAATNSDQETDKSCCSVCLQDFGSRQFVRALPQCQHIFHVRCIDNWLQRNASCPLCRGGVHIDHIHM